MTNNICICLSLSYNFELGFIYIYYNLKDENWGVKIEEIMEI